MYPSASLCREQESLQRDRAASASLQNVRIVAERAASAWCIEAVAAEKREARHERTRLNAAQQHDEATIADASQRSDEDDQRDLSKA
ncbi:MAG: hypothetical protein ABWY12_20840 [Burkholderiales bacterium]